MSRPQRDTRSNHAVDGTRRKLLGAWYTPPALVDAVVREAVFPGALSVLDPACGDGRFLVASGLPQQTGVDIDPSTPFVHDDSLRRDWGGASFDVVLGNPPFLSQLSASTSRGGSSAFGGGPYADVAAEFLELAIRLARPGGRVGMVLPLSMLSTRDAAPIRAAVDRRAALRWMWWSTTHMFDANVRVWAGVWEVGGERDVVRRSYGPAFEELAPMPMPAHWSALLTGSTPTEHRGAVLGDVASFTVDFRDHYYGLVDAVSDDAVGPPLVTSGLIDPGRCWWGERPVRFARSRFDAPRVAIDRLSPVMRQWADRRLVPKILIANQTRVIEAVHDVHGEWLPGVPVISCVTSSPDVVLDVLASDSTTAWVHDRAAGSGLGAGTVRLSPALLSGIPLPTPSGSASV